MSIYKTMSYIMLTMALGLTLLVVAASAKQYPDGSQSYPPGKVCFKPKEVIRLAEEKYGERPLFSWQFGTIQHVMFWNADTETWTIFGRVKDDKGQYIMCAVSAGPKMRPVTPSNLLNGEDS